MTAPLAVILAAGKGTRMKSDRAKVLHELGGRPLVAYPIRAAQQAGATRVVVVTGYAQQEVRQAVTETSPDSVELAFANQDRQLGTGHAVFCALDDVPNEPAAVLILSGDVPLLRSESLRELISAYERSDVGAAFATFEPEDLTGYGRVDRDEGGRVVRIVEDRDCDSAQKAITECNSGTYCIDARHLHEILPGLGRSNAQGEMYLTDLVEALARRGEVTTISIDPIEAAGVNTQEQLRELEGALAAR
jgi:bifunctional UDP-N-acetylglucosamine pyrophosphorylase/glucosamine-1-phosphate N-acetyltransferase